MSELVSRPRTVSLVTVCQSPSTTSLGYWGSLDCVKCGKIILVCLPVHWTVFSRSLLGNIPDYLYWQNNQKNSRAFLPRSRHFKGVGAYINCAFTVSCEITCASILLRATHFTTHERSFGRGESLTLVKCISVPMKKETSLLCQDAFHLIH